MPNENRNPTQAERDERITLPLDPETALRGLLAVSPDDEWVVQRYGVEPPEFLSKTGKWGTIATAAWFGDQATAQAALCPPGSTGAAVRMTPVPRST